MEVETPEQEVEYTEAEAPVDEEVVDETYGEQEETEVESETSDEAPEPPEAEALQSRLAEAEQGNRELQRKIVELIERQTQAAQPKQEAASPDFITLAKEAGFDDPNAEALAKLFDIYERERLSKTYAPKQELERLGGTLAHLARNADEARVFEDLRKSGVPDKDIKDARALVDQMVDKENAYFPNAQVAMDAALGRLSRQRATRTATETSAARATKTAKRSHAEMGQNRGGAGVPVLSDEEKAAAYNMPTDEFLAWLDKKSPKAR